ncbi:MAG: hypothetical protein JWN37_633 [Candidatus Nomurabacteria bacterium]|nr:hypothetical protein [Candidatus Nomurabacteria bacterium]
MFNLFREIRELRDEGKLHTKLISRTRMLFIISAILLFVVLFNIFFRDITFPILLLIMGLAIIGFFLGLYVFSQMNVVNWNEEEEILKSGKMDKAGWFALALYIVFEISLRTFLNANFPTFVIPLLLSGIFGTILGRAIGTLVEIHRVYEFNYTK